MTFPLADSAFNDANIAALRVAEHRGDIDYLAVAVSASGEHRPPAPPALGALAGAATYATRSAPPTLAEGSAASPPAEPGRCSVIEIFNESERIRLLIEARRARTEGSQ